MQGRSGFSAARPEILLIGLFVASLGAVTPRIYASDEAQYFAYLRSLWFDHDVSFDNEYRAMYDRGWVRTDGFRATFLERTTETGRRLNFATLGCAMLWSPLYGVADIYQAATRGRTSPERSGFEPPYVRAVAWGSALYGLFALLLSCAIVRRLGLEPSPAVFTVWLGTPLLFYMYVAPPMSHACSAFAVALFVWTWLRVRDAWQTGGCVALGIAAALMAMVREQDVFFLVGPAVDFAWRFVRAPSERMRLFRGALAGAAAGAACYLPQVAAYVALNGSPGPSRLVARKMTWWAPHGLQVLASPEHGLLFWTPLAALALAGLMIAWRRAAPDGPDTPCPRIVTVCLLAMIATQVYVSGAVESWTVAGAFGQRRFVGLTAFFVIGLAVLWARAGRGRRLLAFAFILCVWWNLGLMAQFGTGEMDRQRLELGRNAAYTFGTLPAELPRLVWRYLFDRASFYRPAP